MKNNFLQKLMMVWSGIYCRKTFSYFLSTRSKKKHIFQHFLISCKMQNIEKKTINRPASYKVANGSVMIGHPASERGSFILADPTPPITFGCLTFKTRPPRQLPPFGNILRAFPHSVWGLMIAAILVFAAVFFLFHTESIYCTWLAIFSYFFLERSCLCCKFRPRLAY